MHAPTYTVLSDSTFRTFVALAEELGIAKDIRRGAPPSVELATGAEVLFRSADEPDRLRGPNLSGVWLDEASLNPREVFEVAIGRLREGGEHGFLSATFTPKGRGHWTFETFATGRPDTAIFYARTADNPFLPVRFENAVRQQYTSTLAEQELEGQVHRRWRCPLSTGLVRHRGQGASLVRPGSRMGPRRHGEGRGEGTRPGRDRGYQGGQGQDGTVYILDLRHLRGSPGQVESLVLDTARADGQRVPIAMEQEARQRRASSLSRPSCASWRATSSTGCPARAARLTERVPFAAQAEGGKVKLLRGPWNKLFLDEAELFPFGAHDDCIDAATLTFTRLSWRQIESLPDVLPLTPGYSPPGTPKPFPAAPKDWSNGRLPIRF